MAQTVLACLSAPCGSEKSFSYVKHTVNHETAPCSSSKTNAPKSYGLLVLLVIYCLCLISRNIGGGLPGCRSGQRGCGLPSSSDSDSSHALAKRARGWPGGAGPPGPRLGPGPKRPIWVWPKWPRGQPPTHTHRDPLPTNPPQIPNPGQRTGGGHTSPLKPPGGPGNAPQGGGR